MPEHITEQRTIPRAGFAARYFDRAPAPRMGKPPHVWRGVEKRDPATIPANDGKKYPWMYRCPAPLCFYNITCATEKDAERHRDTHKCPWFAGGTTTIDWSIMSGSFLEPLWGMLDEQMELIMESPNDDVKERARYEARGMAKTLAVLMPPFFHHPDEIAREAKKRYDMRVAQEDYETPGIGRLRLKPPQTTLDMVAAERPAPTAPRSNAVTSTAKLGDREKAAIKNAMSVPGMFTEKDLAKTYGVSEDVIRAVLAEH